MQALDNLQQRIVQLRQQALAFAAPHVQRVLTHPRVARAIRYVDEMPSDRFGLSGSLGLHALVVLYFVFQAVFGGGLPPATDRSAAMAINMDPFIPPPKKDFKIPDVIETMSRQPHFVIEKIKEKPKKKEEKKEKKEQVAAINPTYLALVRGILEKAKRYPRSAFLNGETGDVLLWFIINKQGTVLGFRIEKPSRVASLDQETVALIKRVRGFPPVPPEMGDRERWEFTIPIRYSLK